MIIMGQKAAFMLFSALKRSAACFSSTGIRFLRTVSGNRKVTIMKSITPKKIIILADVKFLQKKKFYLELLENKKKIASQGIDKARHQLLDQ